MIRRNRSVIAGLVILIIIIVIYASVVSSSDLSFAQSSDDAISNNDSVRGSLLIVQEGIAYSTPEEAHRMKLEIMTEYFLNNDNDEFVVNNGLALGHLSIDDVEGTYFLKFSMLKILKYQKTSPLLCFTVARGKILIMQKKYHQLMLWFQFQVKSPIMNQSTSEMTQLQL
jgi:hypothetical protein